MSRIESLLFRILRSALGTEALNAAVKLRVKDWTRLSELAVSQMVGALVFEELNRVGHNMPEELASRWKAYSRFSRKRFDAQLMALNHLGAVLNTENVKMLVLKGMGIALTYPKPELRECGDIDIYCFEDCERVDSIALDYGLCESISQEVMHNSLVVDGIHVENHHNLTNRTNRAEKINDELLLELCKQQALTDDRMPEVLFPSVFLGSFHLMTHTLSHLVESGITVRHLCDITMYLSKYGDSIDREEFFSTLEKTGLNRSAMLLIDICRQYLGLVFPVELTDENAFRDEAFILKSIFHPFKLSFEVKDPLRKFYRKFRMFRHRSRMHRLVFGEPYPRSFLDSFVFLHAKKG